MLESLPDIDPTVLPAGLIRSPALLIPSRWKGARILRRPTWTLALILMALFQNGIAAPVGATHEELHAFMLEVLPGIDLSSPPSLGPAPSSPELGILSAGMSSGTRGFRRWISGLRSLAFHSWSRAISSSAAEAGSRERLG